MQNQLNLLMIALYSFVDVQTSALFVHKSLVCNVRLLFFAHSCGVLKLSHTLIMPSVHFQCCRAG